MPFACFWTLQIEALLGAIFWCSYLVQSCVCRARNLCSFSVLLGICWLLAILLGFTSMWCEAWLFSLWLGKTQCGALTEPAGLADQSILLNCDWWSPALTGFFKTLCGSGLWFFNIAHSRSVKTVFGTYQYSISTDPGESISYSC